MLVASDPEPITAVDLTRTWPGKLMTITGSGFGAGTAVDFPRVTLGGVNCSIVSWNDTTIQVTTPSGAPNVSAVVVTRHGIPSDPWNNIKVILPPPSLTGVGQL